MVYTGRPMRRQLAVILALFAASARAEAPALDWFASLYTPEGVELRSDERVFALFAVLNATGYDDAPLARALPTPRRRFHPVRAHLRDELEAKDFALKGQLSAFFDAHPLPVDRYLRYAVTGKEPNELKGVEVLLAKAITAWGLNELLFAAQVEYRQALKGYLRGLDTPLANARKVLKAVEGRAPVVVMNLLDGQDEVKGVAAEGEVLLIVGPSERPNLEGLVEAYARLTLEGPVLRRAGAWAGGAAALREAQQSGARETSVPAYAATLLARAVALRATEAPEAAYESAAQKGYPGLRELSHAFDDPKPLEAWVVDALTRASSRKSAARK